MAYETAVLMQLGARTAKHLIRMGGFSPHIRLTDYGNVGWLHKYLGAPSIDILNDSP